MYIAKPLIIRNISDYAIELFLSKTSAKRIEVCPAFQKLAAGGKLLNFNDIVKGR